MMDTAQNVCVVCVSVRRMAATAQLNTYLGAKHRNRRRRQSSNHPRQPTTHRAKSPHHNTIHSELSIYSERGSYHTGLFQFAEEKRRDLKKKTVLIIDEVSMVDA